MHVRQLGASIAGITIDSALWLLTPMEQVSTYGMINAYNSSLFSQLTES